LSKLVGDGWGKSWGIYLTCGEPLADVRKHLRRFLTVDQNGQNVLLRYYDPRILRVFLPVCTAEEVTEFYGPISAFLVEARNPAELVEFRITSQGVGETRVPVAVG
jgi:hypothetical protein